MAPILDSMDEWTKQRGYALKTRIQICLNKYFGMIFSRYMGENETCYSCKGQPNTGHLISVFLLLSDFYLFDLDTGLLVLSLSGIRVMTRILDRPSI